MVRIKKPWRLLRIGGSVDQQSAPDPSSTGPSALLSQNLSNISVTAEELVKYLGEDIELFDIESVSEVDHERLQELKALGERWESSRIDSRAPGVREWRTDSKTAQLVQIACHASNAIRPRPSAAPAKPLGTDEFKKIGSINSGLSGMVKKVISLYYYGTAGGGVVAVCVRAGGRWGDWVINGGFMMSDVEGFIDVANPALHNTIGSGDPSTQSNHESLQAHQGFLTAARESAADVASALRKALNNLDNNTRYPITRILFAGHSAGGAVTSLLFAHFLSHALAYPFLNPANVSLSLITFGSPPILSQNINLQLEARFSPSSIFLAFVIEGDPVLKLDMNYMKFLADCLRLTSTFIGNQAQDETPPPPLMLPLTLYGIGDVIVFPNKREERDGRDVRMLTAEKDILGRATWVNLTVHFMHKYLEFVSVAPGLKVELT